MVSGSDSAKHSGHKCRCAWSSFPAYSLKAGYTARSPRFCAPPCRFIPDSYAKRLPNKRSSQLRRTSFKSPRKPGRMLHANGARKGSLTPSIHPKLGVKSRHQGLHRCALHRIFRPYLEEAVLTRILRRRMKFYHEYSKYSSIKIHFPYFYSFSFGSWILYKYLSEILGGCSHFLFKPSGEIELIAESVPLTYAHHCLIAFS